MITEFRIKCYECDSYVELLYFNFETPVYKDALERLYRKISRSENLQDRIDTFIETHEQCFDIRIESNMIQRLINRGKKDELESS